jgi:hypothetical protein
MSGPFTMRSSSGTFVSMLAASIFTRTALFAMPSALQSSCADTLSKRMTNRE